MKHRINNIIKTLEGLPQPTYSGEVLNARIVEEIEEFNYINGSDKAFNKKERFITVVAERFGKGSIVWLEWTFEL